MTAEITILHADEHLLVVDKPTGRLVVPAPGRTGATVVDLIGRQLGERVHAVHRLDEDTTGVLVLARTIEAKTRLEAEFKRHAFSRRYLALLSRKPSPAAGRVESRLEVGADGVVRSVDDRRANVAITEYHCIARRDRFTLAECRPLTGRRNQIRVHMADLGCPIVGDRKYGYRQRDGVRRFARPMLHAHAIELRHPFEGREIEIRCESPEPELRLPPE